MTTVIKNINKAGSIIRQTVTSNDRGPRGETGATGISISRVDINDAGHLIVTFSNGETQDAGAIVPGRSKIYSWNIENDSTSTFPISPAIDPNSASYISINGVIYSDSWSVNQAGNQLTLTFGEGELPVGKLLLFTNNGKVN